MYAQHCFHIFTGSLLTVAAGAANAQFTTAFTYQGVLQDAGAPAQGLYDLRFILYNAEIGGSQVGPIINLDDVDLIDGRFTVQLDFGGGAFSDSDRWLEVKVRPGDSTGSYTTLSPRQWVTPSPYALHAQDAAGVGGQRFQSGTATTGPDGTISVIFDTPFATAPSVFCTAMSTEGGVVMTLVSTTPSGFTAKATVPAAMAGSYTHSHTLTSAGDHTHLVAGEAGHDHGATTGFAGVHLHVIPIALPHDHDIGLDGSHDHDYFDALSVDDDAGDHYHMFDRVTAILGVVGGAPFSFQVETDFPADPFCLNDPYAFYAEGGTYPHGPSPLPYCEHTHLATIDQVVQHAHYMEMVETPTSTTGNHGHTLNKAVAVTSFELGHDHFGKTGGGGGHDHAGFTGAAVAHAHPIAAEPGHAHGGVTGPGMPLEHVHDVDPDTHTHTVSVGPVPVSVTFSWIACGQ